MNTELESIPEKSVRVDVHESIPRYDVEKLAPFQDELKDLSKDDFAKLRESIIEHGFFVPVFLWHDGQRLNLLDGHQRIRVLLTLKHEGWSVPKIPAVEIKARDQAEASEKLLLITSNFGKINKQGLYKFLIDRNLEAESIVVSYSLSNIDAPKFMDEFFNDGTYNIDPLPPLAGSLASVGGNGVKMLQLFFSEQDHQTVLRCISALQKSYGTQNATDTVMKALENEIHRNSNPS